MKIVQAPDQVLSTVARPVNKIDKYILSLLKEMATTLVAASDPEGVGLAAPQIGKSLQIFIVKENPDSPVLNFINPVIESFYENPKAKDKKPLSKTESASGGKKSKGITLEGCLSLKDIWGVVKREYGVVLSYQDENGIKHTEKFDGFMSTIIQHENDHLNGMLFPKRVLEQKTKLYKSVKDEKGETEFEELEI